MTLMSRRYAHFVNPKLAGLVRMDVIDRGDKTYDYPFIDCDDQVVTGIV